MGLAHDVSRELRGEHGKWSKGGSAIDRMAKEAAGKPGGHKQGDRVKYKTGSLGTVHHVDDKGTPHVVWDRGRGKPVATPAHHLTSVEGEKKQAAATEKAAREVTGAKKAASEEKAVRSKADIAKEYRQEKLKEIGHVPYKPPRQAGSRGGVPAPTAGGPKKTADQINEEFRRKQGLNKPSGTTAAGYESQIRSGNISPELQARIKKIEAEQKAKNAATGRGGALAPKTGPDLGYQNQRAGQAEALRRIAGGGVPAKATYHAGDTPVPGDTARALDKWTSQGGHMKVSADERKLIAATVRSHGGQAPAGLVRGESEQTPSRYVPGSIIRLSPASFSREEESALPYAESGAHSPTLLHLETAGKEVPSLNVSGRASAVNGFSEQEHIVSGRFKATRSYVDSEGIRHVTITPA